MKQPRVHDRRGHEQAEKFASQILPPYLRKTKSIEELIPWLYLKGISTGDFNEALAAILGPQAPGLSATTVTRLKTVWQGEYQAWSKRSLKGKHYVYIWADGVHFNIRLGEKDRLCILVVIGATADGTKELIAIQEGHRESEQSWKTLLLACQERGWRSLRSWPRRTEPWAFGRRCPRYGQRRGASVAGCIRRRMCWTNCPSVSRASTDLRHLCDAGIVKARMVRLIMNLS